MTRAAAIREILAWFEVAWDHGQYERDLAPVLAALGVTAAELYTAAEART